MIKSLNQNVFLKPRPHWDENSHVCEKDKNLDDIFIFFFMDS